MNEVIHYLEYTGLKDTHEGKDVFKVLKNGKRLFYIKWYKDNPKNTQHFIRTINNFLNK